MEFCRRAGDHSFSLRLPVRDSASPGPGYRRDLPNTFGQLSYPKLTSRRFHLLLPWIGGRNSGGSIGTLSRRPVTGATFSTTGGSYSRMPDRIRFSCRSWMDTLSRATTSRSCARGAELRDATRDG